MNRLRKLWSDLRDDETLYKRIYTISVVFAVLVLVMIAKDLNNNKTYIVDESGEIVGFERNSLDRAESFSFRLQVIGRNGISERKVTINKEAVTEDAKRTPEVTDSTDAEIVGVITDAELDKHKRIILPLKLNNGTRLRWLKADENGTDLILMVTGYMLLMAVLIADTLRKPVTDGELIREKVLRGLPRFVNQLLLMLNSGMILSDALGTIVDSYRLIPEGERGYFEQELIRLEDMYAGHGVSPAVKLNEFARQTKVKELIRIAQILYENERRGFDITDNLSRESGFLWEDRKIVAKERGKIIDTRMSYPLGILLLLLIVITMAPAMLMM